MQIIVSGLIIGFVYGLAALGLVLIYKTTDIVNFAQGEMAMVTTFMSFVFLTQLGMPYFVSFLLALIFASLFGIAVYQMIMKRVQDSPPLNQMVLTLGLFLVINGIAGLIWGYHPRSYPEAIAGDPYQIGTVFITLNEIFMVGLTFILMLFFFLNFRYAKIGLAMRASSQDTVAAELMGIKVSHVFMSAWAIGSVLGGVAGIMTAPFIFLNTTMMMDVLILAFAGAVIGGFVSLPGAVIGGVIVGVYENLVSYYIAPELKMVYTFILIIVILYVRPQGILGGPKFVKKV